MIIGHESYKLDAAVDKELYKMSNIWRYSSRLIQKPENLAEHSFYVAVKVQQLGHAFGISEERITKATKIALCHDLGEIYTGDIPHSLKAYSPESESWSHVCDLVQFGSTSNHDSCLRIEKRSGEVKCFWKDNVGNDWTEIATYKTPVGMFGFETFAGFAVHGISGQNPAQFVFSNIDVKEIETPTLIMLK